MPTPRPKPALATAALLVLLSACGHNPEFRTNLADEAYASLGDLYTLLAQAELGTLRSRSSFAGEARAYGEIIGGFEVSHLLARATGPAASGAPSDDLDRSIAGCVDRVRRMADQHRTAGIPPDAPIIASVRAGCDAAAINIAADAASSWMLATAAGDI